MNDSEFWTGVVSAFMAMDVAVRVAAISFVGFLVVGSLISATQKRWRLAGLLLAAAAMPYVLHAVASQLYQDRLDRRAAFVADLERVELNGVYPRTLEVRGYISADSAASLMTRGLFDEVRVYEWRDRKRGERLTWRANKTCMAVAQMLRSAAATDQRLEYEQQEALKDCVSEERLVGEAATALPDAVILLQDSWTTLSQRGNQWSGGQLELRVRRDGKDQLVDYWELPHVVRPASIFLGQSMFRRTEPPGPKIGAIEFLRYGLGVADSRD